MNIRRFRAHSVSDALAKVKAELGDDAVILNTSRRRLREPSINSAVSVVEVVAAVDFDMESVSGPVGQTMENAALEKNSEGEESRQEPLSDPESGYEGVLKKEIRQLRDMVEQITAVASSGALSDTSSGTQCLYHPQTPSSSRYPLMVMQEVFDLLGMDPGVQRGLAAGFLKAHPAGRPVNHRTVYSWLRQHCSSMIACGELAHESARPCWWAFIGPTGVGKTTTLAKIAAHLKFKHGLRGHIVTVDTYRLGGVEQLKKYADIMEIPFSAARNTGELVKIFSENRKMDFVLVDTIGRNSRSSRHHQELEKMFDAVPGLKAQAFLCATYRASDMAATVKTYRQFPVCGWTVTKTDETLSPGALCTPLLGWRLPVSYITDGQKVPEDIRHATRKSVMDLLFAKGDAHFRRADAGVQPCAQGAGDSVGGETALVEG